MPDKEKPVIGRLFAKCKKCGLIRLMDTPAKICDECRRTSGR